MTGFDVGLAVALLVVTVAAQWIAGDARPRPSDPGVPDDTVSAAGRRLGLTQPFDRYWPARGRVEGVTVELEVVKDGDRDRVLRVRLLQTTQAAFTLQREDRASWLDTDELVVGEQRFDDLFRIRSPHELLARAVLDAPSRDAFAAAGALGAAYDGEQWVLVHSLRDWSEAQVVKAVRAVVRAHLTLRSRNAAVQADPRAALNEIARADRTAGVRLRALDHLLRGGGAERVTLTSRCEDVDVVVRLVAAHALGPDGHPTLERLVRTGSRSVRVRAAGHLAESTQLAVELAGLVEDTFLGALDDPELVQVALLGLTRRGTARSVLPLRELSAGSRLVGGAAPSGEVRRMADGVLQAIRGRLDGTAAGGVSLAQLGSGDVAVVEEDGGDLTEVGSGS